MSPTTRERLEVSVRDLDQAIEAGDAKRANELAATVRTLSAQVKGAKIVADLAGLPDSDPVDLLTGASGASTGDSFAKSILAAGFSLKERPAVELDTAKALGIKAPTLTGAAPTTWAETPTVYVPLAKDRRWIFPYIPTTNAGNATAVPDFTITARTLTGTVQRDVDATTDKATLAHTIVHTLTEIPQHAVVIDGVPNQLLESVPALGSMLEAEGRTAVQESIDDHIWTALNAAESFGQTGADLVAQVRNAVAAMRTAGMNPDLLILDPADAVTLDLIQDSAGAYLFPLRDANTSSPLFGLRVVESVAAVGGEPLLVDTARIGQLYLGTMRVEADPFTGFKKNLTDLRVETNALMHIRDATAAYRIGI